MRYLLIAALLLTSGCISKQEYVQLYKAYQSYYDATKDVVVASTLRDQAAGTISTVSAENRLSTVESAGDALAAVASRVKGL